MLVMHAATNVNPPNRTLSRDGKGWADTFVKSNHQKTDPSFFMIPISQTNRSGWGDPLADVSTEQKFEGRLAVAVLEKEIMKEYSIDPARLYITGPSMGARGTWDIIRRRPDMFAAAAPTAAPALPKDAALYKDQNIWAVCGERDPIVQGQRDTIVAIRKLGGNPIYTELAGRGHDSWRSSYNDPYFLTWMYEQRLGVPWWTVSKAPTGIMGATMTKGWAIVDPPADLPDTFSGGSTPPAGTDAGVMGGASDAGSAGNGPGAMSTSDGGAVPPEPAPELDRENVDAGDRSSAKPTPDASGRAGDARVASPRDAGPSKMVSEDPPEEDGDDRGDAEDDEEAQVSAESEGCSLMSGRSPQSALSALGVALAFVLRGRRRGKRIT
jgi:hypothetical protein